MKNLLALFSTLLVFTASAQQKQDILQYIERYKQIAIDEMVRSKIPASITIAQGILESGAGTSVLSRNSNNHFGIKCKEDWTGGKYYHDDDKPQECFRVYTNPRESFADHSDFLLTRPRYAPLFQLSLTSYKYWALGLKEAGYATNPKYASLLINYIEEYKLAELDIAGVAMIEEREKMLKDAPAVDEKAMAKINAHHNSHDNSVVVVEDVKPKEHHKEAVVAEAKKDENARQEYSVNGIRAIKAEGNEDPFKVAYEYNIDYSYIMQYNDLTTGERFKDGEYVYLQNKKGRGAEATYTVLPGESMRDISQKTGVKVRDLYTKNAMHMNDQVHAGQTVSLQEKRTVSPRTMTYAEYLKVQTKLAEQAKAKPAETPVQKNAQPQQAAITNNNNAYQVQKSDTLYSIARKFNTSVEELKEKNNLETSELKPGQTLVVAD
ncbi:MAG TPA: glucosaminidase domain-containing protein [Chitinophagales bacterium]|nr:glucosaminidase domain-containing protein [Chitinophagales bacterium]